MSVTACFKACVLWMIGFSYLLHESYYHGLNFPRYEVMAILELGAQERLTVVDVRSQEMVDVVQNNAQIFFVGCWNVMP